MNMQYRAPARSAERAGSRLWTPESVEDKARDTFFPGVCRCDADTQSRICHAVSIRTKTLSCWIAPAPTKDLNTNVMNLILRGLNSLDYLIKRAKR